MTGEKQCENCRFWLVEGDSAEGICRRYPPVLSDQILRTHTASKLRSRRVRDECGESITAAGNEFVWCQPVTGCDGFCGEWKSV